jgi:hypothetical protein
LVRQRESFVFETVLSDPAGETGYNTILCFIGITGPEVSEQRVAMRVSQGGQDVPSDKLKERFPRILANLKSALRELPHIRIYDNNDLRTPYRPVAIVESESRDITAPGPEVAQATAALISSDTGRVTTISSCTFKDIATQLIGRMVRCNRWTRSSAWIVATS